MPTIRTGVLGVGHLGYHHARIYSQLENAQLVGIVDTDKTNRDKASTDFGVPGMSTVDELLALGVDAVSLAVPTTVHFEIAQHLLKAGVDVLVEKPIASTVEQAQAMVDLAAAEGRILQVGHIERFNGAIVALFDAVSRPRFIECHRLSPFPNRGDDVSVILDLMIHDLDIVCALDKSEVVSVDAVGVPVLSEQEDIANARIRFASGCVANVTASRVSMERMRKIRVFEENAYLSVNFTAQDVRVYRKKTGPLTDDMLPMDLIDMESVEVKREEPLKMELDSFLACVCDRTRPLVNGEDGLAALKLAQRVVNFVRENGVTAGSAQGA